MFTVYVLKSLSDGRYYYGQTSDFEKRFAEHNSGMSGYTSKYLPWELVYKEEYKTRAEAMKREKYFKSYDGYKWLVAQGIILKSSSETNPRGTKPSDGSAIKRYAKSPVCNFRKGL